ncbi:MAG TPA: LPS export ABC transporter ATP-binding protein, partial [Armatimonadetes bacterium]|nr:LPS export ABC transporter ATP-binding protein [Armatimonadota bacterium]
FYMVMGLVRPNAGRVYLDGLDITNLPVHKRARLGIGYLAQEPSIFKRLTVEGNILLVLEMLGIPREERYRRLAILLDELGLSELRRSYGYQLSGGERRRVEIARALAIEPKFLLLDEPFTGIDPITVSELKGLIRHLKERGIGILLTDHNVRDALTVTDRAYILHQGRILTSGTSEELVKDPVARKFYLGEEFRL